MRWRSGKAAIMAERRESEPYVLQRCSGCKSLGWLRGDDCYACWVTGHDPQRPCRECGHTFAVHQYGLGECEDYTP